MKQPNFWDSLIRGLAWPNDEKSTWAPWIIFWGVLIFLVVF